MNQAEQEAVRKILESPAHGKRARVTRLFKKTSPDSNLTLYLPRRDLVIKADTGRIEQLEGVVQVSENLANKPNIKVIVQVVLELRYGREDEELMGLQFCNEMTLATRTVFSSALSSPPSTSTGIGSQDEESEEKSVECERTEDLTERLGCYLTPFKIGLILSFFTSLSRLHKCIDIGSSLPPTIRLQPTRTYSGSPIGTTYTVLVYPSDSKKEHENRAESVAMAFWVSEEFPPIVNTRPSMSMSKAGNIFSDGEITLEVSLERNVYRVGQPVCVNVTISSRPPRRVSSVKVVAVQAVDVAMFASGYFKIEVSCEEDVINRQVENYTRTFTLEPAYTPGKHWVAVADITREQKTGGLSQDRDKLLRLAASVMVKERSIFMIKVMYYVQVKVKTSHLQRDLILKVPFLMAPHSSSED